MKHFLRPYEFAGIMILGVATGLGAYAQGLQVTGMGGQPALLLHTPSQSYLGVDVSDVEQDRALNTLHIRDGHGAEITVLDHDAPAGKAGLKLHDVIVQMNNQNIESADQLKRMLRSLPAGRKVQLVINRDGVQSVLSVQLADRHKIDEEVRQQMDSGSGSSGGAQGFLPGSGDAPVSSGFHLWGMGSSLKIGALVEPLSGQTAEILGVNNGLMIKSVAHKSAAYAAGLRPYDVILGVGGENVVTSSDWERLLRSSEGKPVQVEIMRDRTRQLVLLQVDGKRH